MLDVFAAAIRERATLVQTQARQEGPAEDAPIEAHRTTDLSYG